MEVDSLELEDIMLVGGQHDHLLEGTAQEHRRDQGQGQGERRRLRDRDGHRHGRGPRNNPRRANK